MCVREFGVYIGRCSWCSCRVWHVWEVWTPVHVQVSSGCSGDVTVDRNVLPEQVASVEESAVGVAGQENECVVTV